MSINPEHVENILCGKKKYEFRKRACKRKVDKIYIYSTSPVMKIVGEVEVKDVLQDTPEHIWEITKHFAGIDKVFFDQYFETRDDAVAFQLGQVIRYNEPVDLVSIGVRTAPQSYQYIEDLNLEEVG
ncbi:MAG: ASCH domain-containing protein [Lachnospiraceae bacterium]